MIIVALLAYPRLVCLATEIRRTSDAGAGQRKAFWEVVFLCGAAAETTVSGEHVCLMSSLFFIRILIVFIDPDI